MRRPIQASPNNGPAVRALVDRLTSKGGGRAESLGAVTEQRDRCDVLIHTRRQWVGEPDAGEFTPVTRSAATAPRE